MHGYAPPLAVALHVSSAESDDLVVRSAFLYSGHDVMTGIQLGLTEDAADAARPAMRFLLPRPAGPLAVQVEPAWEGIGSFAFRG